MLFQVGLLAFDFLGLSACLPLGRLVPSPESLLSISYSLPRSRSFPPFALGLAVHHPPPPSWSSLQLLYRGLRLSLSLSLSPTDPGGV